MFLSGRKFSSFKRPSRPTIRPKTSTKAIHEAINNPIVLRSLIFRTRMPIAPLNQPFKKNIGILCQNSFSSPLPRGGGGARQYAGQVFHEETFTQLLASQIIHKKGLLAAGRAKTQKYPRSHYFSRYTPSPRTEHLNLRVFESAWLQEDTNQKAAKKIRPVKTPPA